MADIIILIFVFGYCAYIIRNRRKKTKNAGGCQGCGGSCAGCSGCSGFTLDEKKSQ
ncbi:MAG TPA: FeoB-associated Cys-rich membrane protein [Candidatus Anaerostipes excrementavium]|uniref:FeoB-associated Cys-rich membrane protein n=1 Tax=Candidatus Anaerostipes excrementavium TaxID=2838463 RepID=A0A9D1WUW2_9FIRM|nr:FeoB-associated Cys-rich membrane protein [uncultured Anaerostipes sp.]HIX67703.1 FeoB-associated Cys-rich membrane protein [Candidatus Anaerostipes excrementavium]